MYHRHLLYQQDHSQWIVLLHGFLGFSSDWHVCVDGLKDGYNILCVDLYELIHHDSVLSFDSLAIALYQLFAHYKISKPILIGYSLGGRLAMHYASMYPQSFSALILESAHPGFSDSEKSRVMAREQTRIRQHTQSLISLELSDFLSNWYEQALFCRSKYLISSADFLKKSRLSKSMLQSILIELSSLNQHFFFDYIDLIKVPILYLYGALDQKYCVISEQFKSVSNVHYYCIDEADHNCHLSQPVTFLSYINAFLR